MITFDQLRSALFDAEPHVALDQLIRAELGTGRTAQAVYDELLNHVDGLRVLPNYSDELEDPLGDKLDALCGWIYEGSAYQDGGDTGTDITTRHPAGENGHTSTTAPRTSPQP